MLTRGKNTQAPASAGKKKGGRWANFSSGELDIMLNLVDEQLPMGGDQWEYLTLEFNKKVATDRFRDMESLRKKFKNLKNKRKPTRDPDCPQEVKRAKRADRRIQERMSVENMGSSSEDEEEDEEGEFEFVGETGELEDGDDVEVLVRPTIMMMAGDEETPPPPPAIDVGNLPTTAEQGVMLPFSPPQKNATATAPTKNKKSKRPPINPAGATRTGMTLTEIHHAARQPQRVSSPASSVSSSTPTSSTTKKTIDTMLDQLMQTTPPQSLPVLTWQTSS